MIIIEIEIDIIDIEIDTADGSNNTLTKAIGIPLAQLIINL